MGEPFAPPHIERWCNGWQVRAHFFAYFKYAQYKNSAATPSILLNHRRLSISLDWYCYKADVSLIAPPEHNRRLDNFDTKKYAASNMWHGMENEYDGYRTVTQQSESDRRLQNDEDFFCIGKRIERDDLGRQDITKWIAEAVGDLLSFYEAYHGK